MSTARRRRHMCIRLRRVIKIEYVYVCIITFGTPRNTSHNFLIHITDMSLFIGNKNVQRNGIN